MSTYISLLRYTQKGIESVKESPGRLDAARTAFEKIGARLKDLSISAGRWTIFKYRRVDMLGLVVPDD
jgi:uncharacterized protein with GYD domain